MTLPAGAALGSTQDPQQLIKGEPDQVAANASALSDEATRIQGLADDVDAISIPGWSGGFGEPAYTYARGVEQKKWSAYVDLLTSAGKSLSTYADALRAAQGRAQDAITKWNEGEAATEKATTEYNQQVTAYNEYQNRQVCVPTYGGGSSVPSIGPSAPGPFVDPGEALRKEAEQILDDARTALEAAGALTLKELGALEGAKTEGSSGPKAEGDIKGPSFSWGDWEDTFGKDPTKGQDGKYDRGGSESPFKLDLGSIEGEARVWGAEGSIEDYWGDVKVHANGSVTVLGASGDATASLGEDGLIIGAHGKVTIIGAEGEVGGEWGIAEATAHGEVFAGADAEGDVLINGTGAHASGELFAGAKATGDLSGDVGGVGGKVEGEAWAGIGASGHIDFGMEDGKFTIGGSGGLAFGIGGKVGGEITIDPGEVLETGEDIIEGIGGLFS